MKKLLTFAAIVSFLGLSVYASGMGEKVEAVMDKAKAKIEKKAEDANKTAEKVKEEAKEAHEHK